MGIVSWGYGVRGMNSRSEAEVRRESISIGIRG